MAKRSMRLMGLGLALVLLSGCAAAALVGAGAGAGTYAYLNGELKREYKAPLDHTWAATVQSLKDLEVRVLDSEKDQLGGKIDARLYDGRSVKLTVEAKENDITLVKIRVGTFGDQHISELIGDSIQNRI